MIESKFIGLCFFCTLNLESCLLEWTDGNANKYFYPIDYQNIYFCTPTNKTLDIHPLLLLKIFSHRNLRLVLKNQTTPEKLNNAGMASSRNAFKQHSKMANWLDAAPNSRQRATPNAAFMPYLRAPQGRGYVTLCNRRALVPNLESERVPSGRLRFLRLGLMRCGGPLSSTEQLTPDL